MTTNGKIIPVAVAVLRYGDEFLLATRQSHQHQGGKLEFVGGKIEEGETPQVALVREVGEELGLDISTNIMTKLGRICHDYVDKSVHLFVHQIWLNDSQYLDFKDKKVGLDGQSINFYGKEILSDPERFPSANAPILMWLTLPAVISISHELGAFATPDEWLGAYRSLPMGRTLLMRTGSDAKTSAKLLADLSLQRDDIKYILSLSDMTHSPNLSPFALRLTERELLTMDTLPSDVANLPIIVSCHDKNSIDKANALTKNHPVMAVLLSPVLPTKTHPDSPALGWERFSRLAEQSDVPVIALGGLRPSDIQTAYRHGAVAVAGIRAFL